MFSQTCRRVIPSVHGGGVCASGSGGCTPPGRAPQDSHSPPPGLAPPGHNGQQAGGTHPTGMLSFLFLVAPAQSRATYLLSMASVCLYVCMYVCMFVDSYNLISTFNTRWLTSF